jgi:phospholipid/cholesterol/gamma-HCH transport system substrate-binding protein
MRSTHRFRYGNEAVGALVLAALAIFIAAALQGGVLRAWFNPRVPLHVVLPEQGLFGLAPGAPVEILGTKAGEVTRIVVEPGQRFIAEAEIDEAMRTFVRRDSKAFIRKQFGIAGAAYLEVTRGQDQPLDWEFAVIDAAVDKAPTEDVGKLIEDLRAKVLPIIDETKRAVTALADAAESLRAPDGRFQTMLADLQSITARLQRGEGTLGRVLADNQLARDLQTTVTTLSDAVRRLPPMLAELDRTAGNVSAVSGAVRAQADALPDIMRNTNATLSTLRQVTRDLGEATPGLPALLAQTQQTTLELERLLLQLRSLWLLGGSGEPPEDGYLSPLEVRP